MQNLFANSYDARTAGPLDKWEAGLTEIIEGAS